MTVSPDEAIPAYVAERIRRVAPRDCNYCRALLRWLPSGIQGDLPS